MIEEYIYLTYTNTEKVIENSIHCAYFESYDVWSCAEVAKFRPASP